MPLLYGEGLTKAFERLQEEILKTNDDHTILLWQSDTLCSSSQLLARSPRDFRRGLILSTLDDNVPYSALEIAEPWTSDNDESQNELFAHERERKPRTFSTIALKHHSLTLYARLLSHGLGVIVVLNVSYEGHHVGMVLTKIHDEEDGFQRFGQACVLISDEDLENSVPDRIRIGRHPTTDAMGPTIDPSVSDFRSEIASLIDHSYHGSVPQWSLAPSQSFQPSREGVMVVRLIPCSKDPEERHLTISYRIHSRLDLRTPGCSIAVNWLDEHPIPSAESLAQRSLLSISGVGSDRVWLERYGRRLTIAMRRRPSNEGMKRHGYSEYRIELWDAPDFPRPGLTILPAPGGEKRRLDDLQLISRTRSPNLRHNGLKSHSTF